VPYAKQTWADTGTAPNGVFTAARANHMEDGISSGYSSVLDVDGQFGGGWSGVEAAVAEAVSSGGQSACVMLGRGDYAADSTITITEPIAIRGMGRHQTRIKHASGFSGFVFQGFTGRRNGMWEGSSGAAPDPVYVRGTDGAGMEFSDFAIIDDNQSTANCGGIWLAWQDDVHMANLLFGYLTGTALKLGTYTGDTGPSAGISIPAGSGRIRESNFVDINIYRCGRDPVVNGSDVPSLLIQSSDGNGDGTNQNVFNRVRLVFNEGRVLLRSRSATGGNMRRTTFRDVQLHGLYDSDWSPPYRQTTDLITIEGDVGTTTITGLTANANASGTALVAVKQNSYGETPQHVVVKDVNTVNVGGDVMRVDQGQYVTLEGDFRDVGGMVLRNNNSSIGTYYVNAYGQSNPLAKVTTTYGSGAVVFNGTKVST
jgi:hypothetical protein